ncbi:MAG: polysaccharide biosynthesis/export family protein, partial [Terracidiphilus sp.]
MRGLMMGCFLAGAMLAGQSWARGQEPTAQSSGSSQQTSAQPAGNDPASQKGHPHDTAYVIGNDDVLAINVWKEPDLTRSVPVRSDGKISLPLVGELQAAGRTPLELEIEIGNRLKSYITAPEVTVMVQELNSRKFNILGEVNKPGSYPLAAPTTVMDAIATAGGFRDFAKKKGVYVLRQGPKGGVQRIQFNYAQFLKGKHREQNIYLEPHDSVIV